jgi:hypothetical protein
MACCCSRPPKLGDARQALPATHGLPAKEPGCRTPEPTEAQEPTL